MSYKNPEKQRERQKRYFQEHKEELRDKKRARYHRNIERYRLYYRDYHRRHTVVSTNRVFYALNKRPYLGSCELCGRNDQNTRLAYHHWDDEQPQQGLWLCSRCHQIATFAEEGKYAEYFRLKRAVEIQSAK